MMDIPIPKKKDIMIYNTALTLFLVIGFIAALASISLMAEYVGINDKYFSGYVTKNVSEVQTDECVEHWQCGEWGECVDSKQIQVCNDLNECSMFHKTVYTERLCDHCRDGKRNFNEDGIDCGGGCEKCQSEVKPTVEMPAMPERGIVCPMLPVLIVALFVGTILLSTNPFMKKHFLALNSAIGLIFFIMLLPLYSFLPSSCRLIENALPMWWEIAVIAGALITILLIETAAYLWFKKVHLSYMVMPRRNLLFTLMIGASIVMIVVALSQISVYLEPTAMLLVDKILALSLLTKSIIAGVILIALIVGAVITHIKRKRSMPLISDIDISSVLEPQFQMPLAWRIFSNLHTFLVKSFRIMGSLFYGFFHTIFLAASKLVDHFRTGFFSSGKRDIMLFVVVISSTVITLVLLSYLAVYLQPPSLDLGVTHFIERAQEVSILFKVLMLGLILSVLVVVIILIEVQYRRSHAFDSIFAPPVTTAAPIVQTPIIPTIDFRPHRFRDLLGSVGRALKKGVLILISVPVFIYQALVSAIRWAGGGIRDGTMNIHMHWTTWKNHRFQKRQEMQIERERLRKLKQEERNREQAEVASRKEDKLRNAELKKQEAAETALRTKAEKRMERLGKKEVKERTSVPEPHISFKERLSTLFRRDSAKNTKRLLLKLKRTKEGLREDVDDRIAKDQADLENTKLEMDDAKKRIQNAVNKMHVLLNDKHELDRSSKFLESQSVQDEMSLKEQKETNALLEEVDKSILHMEKEIYALKKERLLMCERKKELRMRIARIEKDLREEGGVRKDTLKAIKEDERALR